MKTGQTLFFAVRLAGQIASVNGSARQVVKRSDHSTKSAALLAFIGLSMSGFSLKQMAQKSRKF